MPNRRKAYVDMEKYRKTRNAQRKRYYEKTRKYDRRSWTEAEDILVLRHCMTDTELSNMIKRSVCAIQNRRAKLKART